MQLRGANFVSSGHAQALFTAVNLAVAREVREIRGFHFHILCNSSILNSSMHSLALGGAIVAESYMQLSGYDIECAACICDLIPRLMHADVVTCASTSLHLVLLPMHLPRYLLHLLAVTKGSTTRCMYF